MSFMPPAAGAMAENISKPHVKWGGSPPLQIMHEHSTYLPRAPLLNARHKSHQHLEVLAWHARRISPSPSSPLTFFRETWVGGWRGPSQIYTQGGASHRFQMSLMVLTDTP